MTTILLTATAGGITFKDAMPWILTIFFGLLTAWVTSKRDLKKETKDDTYTIASIAADLKNISKEISTINQENKELRTFVYNMQADVIRLRTELEGVIENGK